MSVYLLLASSVGGIIAAVVLGAVVLLMIALRFRRGFRDPESPASSRSMLSKDYADTAFKKPRDENRLL